MRETLWNPQRLEHARRRSTGVVIDQATGWLRCGADPRRGGYALGW